MKTKNSRRNAKPATKSKSAAATPMPAISGDGIEHVVVLMLENRSFDHLLGSLKSLYPELAGIDPANPRVNYEAATAYPQMPTAKFMLPYGVDPKHELADVKEQLTFSGPGGGFVHNFIRHYQDKQASAPQVMAYFDRQGANRLPVLHTLAELFTICDHWFSSVPGPTWPNRFFVHSGTSNGWVNMPVLFHNWHDYDQVTLYDRLNEQQISWQIYFDDFPQSLMLEHQRQANNRVHYKNMSSFYSDAKGPEANFPQYVFIEPCYFGGYENDQHPPANMLDGEVLIAKVYNAIRANEALWQKTLLVILYDEHGGFYDQATPPAAPPPDALAGDGFDFKQLGLRVPALLISPYAAQGVLSDTFDHTSLLRYVSDKWGLGPLGARTAAANSFANALLSSPRMDTPAHIPEPSADVAAPSGRKTVASKAGKAGRRASKPAPLRPINDLQANLLTFSQVLDAETKESAARKVRRVQRSMNSAEDHTAVALERVKKFLAQSRRQPRGPKVRSPRGHAEID